MLSFLDVSKKYPSSDRFAVQDISFTVISGSITALLGPNGAGKTTTMKMAGGVLFPCSGHVQIDGLDSVKDLRAYRKLVGLHLGGELGFYTRSSVIDNLIFFDSLASTDRKNRRQKCTELLDRVGLEDKKDVKVEQLSHGMRQRLHLARSIVANPPVVLLDEPTSGLDPSQASSIRNLILDLPKCGTAVLLSTHHMVEAHQLANKISIINHGKLVLSAKPNEILKTSGKKTLEEAYLWVIANEQENT